MRFWDTSALVPLLLKESTSPTARQAFSDDSDIVVWWGTSIECTAAIARAERDARIDREGMTDALAGLRLLQGGWSEMDATVRLRESAERLARVHPLRAADSMQLASAIAAADGVPTEMPLVTLDDRLTLAAEKEGFPVVRFDRAPS